MEWTAQILAPGEYALLPEGVWYAATPNGHMANLSGHTVEEHEDGTITVSRSIRVFQLGPFSQTSRGPERDKEVELWHGFLEHGVWRDA